MIDLRLRVKVSPAELQSKVGKILGPADYNVLLTGPSFVRMPDNRPLAVYLPGVLAKELDADGIYEIFHSIQRYTPSVNRGLASGTPRYRSRSGRSYTKPISSVIVGASDPQGQKIHCRLTAWTGQNMPEWQRLLPVFQAVAEHQRKYVPSRAQAQWDAAQRTNPAWVIPGTPFSTITVNNTYPTGVHTDKGDLDEGFSTIACIRKGEYTGGHLVFPEYRVAVDMKHGDLLLMDAHQWHGNVAMVCACGTEPSGRGSCTACGAERISIVSYFRTKMTQCGTPEEELRKASERPAR